MSIGAEPIIYGLIFIGVLVLVEGLYLTVFGKAISLNNKVNRRLDMMKKGQGREDVMDQLRKEMNQHLSAHKVPLYSLLSDKAQKGGIAFSPTQLVMVMGVLCAIAFVGLT
ncbi:MAG: pilus assembly protein TadB, partial [Pseudomonadota bacterium]